MAAELEFLEKLLKPRVLSLVFERKYGFVRDGKSLNLGGGHDRQLLTWLRRRSQMIVTTGKTAELENYKQPSKPLVLITTRPDAAAWLDAERMTVDDFQKMVTLVDQTILYESGIEVSLQLYKKRLIESVVVHHDFEEFDQDSLALDDLQLISRNTYHERYISVFERRGSPGNA